MTEKELIEQADDPYIFSIDTVVVPLKYALQAIAAEREACAELCDQLDITPGRRLAELIRVRT